MNKLLSDRNSSNVGFAIAKVAGFGIAVEGASMLSASHFVDGHTDYIANTLNLSGQAQDILANLNDLMISNGAATMMLGGFACALALTIDKFSRQ